MEVGLAPVSEYFGLRGYVTLPGSIRRSNRLGMLYTMILKLLLTSSRPIVRRRKNVDPKIIIFKSQRTPWHTTMSTDHRSDKELSWYARPDLYYQEFRITDHELRTWKHKFLKRLDMYHELIYDEKDKSKGGTQGYRLHQK